MRTPSFSLHTLLLWACPPPWDIVQTLSLDRSPSPISPCAWAGLHPQSYLGCPFSQDRLQLGDELLLFSIHHCVLFSCHQGLLMISACHRRGWSLSSCVSHQNKLSSRFRCRSLRTANAPALSPCDAFCGGEVTLDQFHSRITWMASLHIY